MVLLVAILLAFFVLPWPWNLVAVVAGAAWEVAEKLAGLWWSQRRVAKVGAETLVGREVEVREACRPLGRVRVKGELWRARCTAGANVGEIVRVVAVDGLTLVVVPVEAAGYASASNPARSSGAV
jgi:membrane-bound serine protease (ClpP class)